MLLDPSEVRWDWSPSGILAWMWACPSCGRPCENSEERIWSAEQVAADPLCAPCNADQTPAPAPRKAHPIDQAQLALFGGEA